MRILTLTSVYPNPAEPGLGGFLRARLQQMTRAAAIQVIAPVPLVNYARPRGTAAVPLERQDGEIRVLHPRWLYPPGGFPWNPPLLFFQVLPAVLRLRKSFPFQVIDAHFLYPDGVAAALLSRALGCPFSVTLRGSELLHGRHAARRWWMAWAMRRASCAIAVSSELQQFAISLGTEPERTRLIPNGIDATAFFPRDRSLVRSRHAVPSGCKLILSAGHLIELKGHHRVIKALAALRRDGMDARLWIAGGSGRGAAGFEGRLRQLVSDLSLGEAVRFLGHVEHDMLAELMSAADVCCLASSREGWPNAVHESLACGTPVVATQVGGVPNLLPSAVYGSIVPVDDLPELERSLREALQKHWDRAAIATWGQSRSWEQVACETLEELRRVVAEIHGRT